MRLKPIGQKEIILLLTAFIGVTYGFGFYLFPAIAESIRKDITFSYATMGLISGAVQVAFLVSSGLAGFLTLRFGAMNMILFSMIVCTLSLAAFALVDNLYSMALLLLILGACISWVWVPMVEVAKEIISEKSQGKTLGLISSGTSYGVFINGLLVATALPIYGWRSLWWMTFAIAMIITLYSIGRLNGLRTHQKNKKIPMKQENLRVRMASMPKIPVIAILIVMFLNGFSCIPFQTYLSVYLIGEIKVDETQVASAWSIIGIVGMFSGFLMGALADKITIRYGIIANNLILCVAALAMMFVGISGLSSLLVYTASLAFGISFYAIFGLVPAYISRLFNKNHVALVFSFGNVALGIGGMVGNIVGGYGKEWSGSFDFLYGMILVASMLSVAIVKKLPSKIKQ